MFGMFSVAKEYKKIVSGGTGNLSRADITDLNVTMSKANKSLPQAQIHRLFQVYRAFSKDKKKMVLDKDTYFLEMGFILLRFDLEADVRKIVSSSEMASFWRDSEEKERRRNEIYALRERIASITGLLEEMRKFEASYKNISDQEIVDAAEKNVITQQKANSIIRKKQHAKEIIESETEELRKTMDDYYAAQREFYVFDCNENGIPELLQKPGIIEDLLKIES